MDGEQCLFEVREGHFIFIVLFESLWQLGVHMRCDFIEVVGGGHRVGLISLR